MTHRSDSLLEVIKSISDRSGQEAAWFGSDPNLMDSPGEQIHALFGPENLDEVIVSREYPLAPEIYDLLSRLARKIRAYQKEVGLDPDPRLTLDHPHWEKIRSVAREIIKKWPQL